MSYTTNRQPQGIIIDKVNFLREGLIAEIVAINDYSLFIYHTHNKWIKDIFYHIMEEEKEHYGMFLDSLRKYDKEHKKLQYEVESHLNIPCKDSDKYSDFSYSKDKNYNILTHIRDAIKGELEAIVLYEYFINNITDKYLIDLISKIITDEKEHVEELTLALKFLDKDKYGPIE